MSLERQMSKHSKLGDRRTFIGGSDPRIIMGSDESLLVRLWREERGEVEPEDLSRNLMVQLGTVTEDLNLRWYERNTRHAVRDMQRRIQHPVIGWMAATLDGIMKGTGGVFEAKLMMPWMFSKEAAAEAHGAAAAQYVGGQLKDGRAVDHHRRRQMARTDHLY
jgi:predicted phage-related endonuclease